MLTDPNYQTNATSLPCFTSYLDVFDRLLFNASWLMPHHTKLVLTTFWKMLPKRAQTVCERSEGSSNCLRSV